MRILIVADEFPWPARSGYRQRLDGVVRALTSEHEVDLAVVVREDRDGFAVPAEVNLRRWVTVTAGPRAESRARRLARWATGRLPRALGWRDWSAARREVAGWIESGGYDVSWVSHASTAAGLSGVLTGPVVVDLDNLESQMLAHRRAAAGVGGSGSAAGRLVHGWGDALDEARWRRLERCIVTRARLTVVCSELDRFRLGGSDVRVVPNGYALPTGEVDAPRSGASDRPVLLMVGLLTYEPNLRAAQFFGREVLPLIRQRIPGAEFRVVGRFDNPARVAGLRTLAGVEVTGEVEEIRGELAAADLAVVPIQFGGGTRIKILEAWAHRLPVVSTPVGAEGLGAVDGEHLLLGSDAAALAEACLRILQEPTLRDRLVSSGHTLWSTRYRWSSIGGTVNAVVREAAT